MRILFLGDVVGEPGCNAIKKNLKNQIKLKKIDFVIVNGENAAKEGVGITEKISNDFFNCGVDVITTGNHVWDCLLYTSPSPRDRTRSRMPSSA